MWLFYTGCCALPSRISMSSNVSATSVDKARLLTAAISTASFISNLFRVGVHVGHFECSCRPGCRKAGRACNNICGTSFSSIASRPSSVMYKTPGMAIAPSGAIVVSPSSQKSTSSCSENLVPVWSVHAWLCSILGTWNDCWCVHLRVSKICRCGLAALSTCSRSHLMTIQPHQCSHDVVVVVTATSPHHHLVVAASSKFRVSQCRVTLDHCW